MGITFTAQQRLDITRRQLNIVTENAAYTATTASLTANQMKLLNVDNANSVFYNFFDTQVRAYELEAQAMNGTQSDEYTNGTISPYTAGDLSTSAMSPGATGATFFPSSPAYQYYIPLITNAVNGYLNPIAVPANTYVLSEASIIAGLPSLIAYINGGGGSATESTTTTVPGGVVTGLVLSVAASTGFASTNIVRITSGSVYGLYEVTGVTTGLTPTITINSIIPATASMTSGTISNALATLKTTSVNYITLWQGYVTTQIAQLTAQNDSRSTQMTQNASALSADNAALTILNAWITTPDYTFATITPLIATRTSFIATRIPQIATALGSVSQTANTYMSGGDNTASYYQRYVWLNIRINRADGSARRYFDAGAGLGMIAMLSADNTSTQTQYNQYFLTKALKYIDTTNIVQVTDLTGLSAGQTITVVSESQPEITRAIIATLGTTQLQLDSPIPNIYQTNSTDIARIFVTLQ